MKQRALEVLAIALAVSVAAVLGGCGGGDSDTTDTTDTADTEATDTTTAVGESVSVSGTEFAFDPLELSVAADTAFTVEFTNDGTMEHDFTIEGNDSDKVAALAGAEATGTFTLTAGTYQFFCSVPGHEAAGMVGTLTVE